MKIISNNAGNYQAATIRSADKKELPIQQNGKDISKEEKEFFVKMYPAQKNEIMDYHFYSPKGKMGGVAVGTKIDLRG